MQMHCQRWHRSPKLLVDFMKYLLLPFSFFAAKNSFIPKDLKKSPKLSAAIVLTLTTIDFSLLHIEQRPIVVLSPQETLSRTMFIVPERCLPPAQKKLVIDFWELVF